MSMYTCRYSIPGGGNGGELTGPGFGPGNPPSLVAQDALTVQLTWAGNPNAAPDSLSGYFVFSPSPFAPPGQVFPSPFLLNGCYRCCDMQTANKSTAPGPITYTFGGYSYAGGYVGQYELTFVAAMGQGATEVQWSADPEFETGN